MKRLILALSLVLAGCGSVTHSASAATPAGVASPATATPATATPAAAQPTSQPSAESVAAATDTPTPTPTPTPAPAKPVVIKGSGTQKTKPFDLADGDYTVTITGNCQSNVIADLYPRGGSDYTGLFNEIAAGRYTYTTQAYGLAGGQYYLDVTDDNAWTVTLTPLN